MGAPSRYILVVEDEPSTVEVLRFNLEERGYTVRAAMDGDEALREIAAQAPALIILDINMPGMSGWEVLDLLPEDDQMAEIPVVVLSGRDTDADIAKSWTYNIVTYFTKPFDMGELLDFVGRTLEVGEDEPE
jgi:DNA-binding response OmpR family regulator